MSTMFLCPTIKELAVNIANNSPGEKTGNIVKLNNGKNKKNIFIFHPLHGMTYPYKELAKLLEDRFTVYGVQARGLTREVPLPGTYDEMLKDYLPRIKAVQETGPYILSGFCIGNVLAYEAARELEDEGESVEKVIMLDTAVFIPEKAVLFYWLRRILTEVIHFTRRFFKKQGKSKSSSPQPHPGQQSTGEEDSKEQELKQRVEANNKMVSMKYQYKRIIRSPILHIRTRENRSIWASNEYWQKMSKETVECFECPGNHDNILAHPYVKKLAEIIKAYL
jgi:thioesterase domain-containing protein